MRCVKTQGQDSKTLMRGIKEQLIKSKIFNHLFMNQKTQYYKERCCPQIFLYYSVQSSENPKSQNTMLILLESSGIECAQSKQPSTQNCIPSENILRVNIKMD